MDDRKTFAVRFTAGIGEGTAILRSGDERSAKKETREYLEGPDINAEELTIDGVEHILPEDGPCIFWDDGHGITGGGDEDEKEKAQPSERGAEEEEPSSGGSAVEGEPGS
jgi:hypothetical protein